MTNRTEVRCPAAPRVRMRTGGHLLLRTWPWTSCRPPPSAPRAATCPPRRPSRVPGGRARDQEELPLERAVSVNRDVRPIRSARRPTLRPEPRPLGPCPDPPVCRRACHPGIPNCGSTGQRRIVQRSGPQLGLVRPAHRNRHEFPRDTLAGAARAIEPLRSAREPLRSARSPDDRPRTRRVGTRAGPWRAFESTPPP